MKQDYTHVLFILDNSGSMQKRKNDVEGSYNGFIADQAKEPGTLLVDLVRFSTVVNPTYRNVPVVQVPPLNYNPVGGTALFDAIVVGVNNLGSYLASLPEDQRPSKVLVAILTDGEERDSRVYSLAKVNEVIKHQTEVYNWQFTFLGANVDAFDIAEKFGINRAATLNFAATKEGVGASFKTCSGKLSDFRRGEGYKGYSNAEREASMAG